MFTISLHCKYNNASRVIMVCTSRYQADHLSGIMLRSIRQAGRHPDFYLTIQQVDDDFDLIETMDSMEGLLADL
jgi:hypothetical protein